MSYDYEINDPHTIEWIIDQHQVKKDKKSDITGYLNNFSDNPKYILNLLLSIINLQEHVGHVKPETTYGYTHRINSSQQKSVEAISDFADKVAVI